MSSEWIRDGRLDPERVIPALRSFLGQIIRTCGLELRAEIGERPANAPEEVENPDVIVNFQGRDAELLLARHGELLRAIEYLAWQWLRLVPPDHERLRFDCENYREGRLAELKLAAQTAAAQVKKFRTPHRFNPMNARERRALHVALKNDPGVRTASEGEGLDRAVVIYPA
ncbi:MAG: R3H domain-containing nucleic acid-binding protein [Candidatus Acidoferrales bacterium]